jgi:hypothetical protein
VGIESYRQLVGPFGLRTLITTVTFNFLIQCHSLGFWLICIIFVYYWGLEITAIQSTSNKNIEKWHNESFKNIFLGIFRESNVHYSRYMLPPKLVLSATNENCALSAHCVTHAALSYYRYRETSIEPATSCQDKYTCSHSYVWFRFSQRWLWRVPSSGI